MGLYDELTSIEFEGPDGAKTTLAGLGDGPFLVVNVASKCGLAPQYEQLEALQQEYGGQGLTVVGFPCNQFLGQEPGSMQEILDYCSTTWDVSFPIMSKVKVNGPGAAPLFKALKESPTVQNRRGPIKWNFTKFLVGRHKLHRFSPTTKPDDPAVITALEEELSRSE